MGNAIKFTQQGEVAIRCSVAGQAKLVTSCEPGDNNRIPLLFEVIDSGIGISKEQKKALFVPFSQVDGSTTSVNRKRKEKKRCVMQKITCILIYIIFIYFVVANTVEQA